MGRISDIDRTKILNTINLCSLLTTKELELIHKIAEAMDCVWEAVKAREDSFQK